MTGQQLQPTDEFTVRWNKWFEASFDAHMSRHIRNTNEALDNLGDEVGKELDGLAEEVGVVAGQQTNKIFELLEIVQVLATGNDFLRGRIAQITKEFEHQNGIEHKATSRTIERTIATTEETSKVSQVVSVIESILAE